MDVSEKFLYEVIQRSRDQCDEILDNLRKAKKVFEELGITVIPLSMTQPNMTVVEDGGEEGEEAEEEQDSLTPPGVKTPAGPAAGDSAIYR